MFDIMFGAGISKSGEIVDLGVELDIIQKSGSWYAYESTKIAQGRDAAKQFIEDNIELANEIEKRSKKKFQLRAAQALWKQNKNNFSIIISKNGAWATVLRFYL